MHRHWKNRSFHQWNRPDQQNGNQYTVNYFAKPVTEMIAPDSAISRVWDEGIGELAQELYDADEWVEENKNEVKVIAGLTGIFTSQKEQDQ